MIEELNVFVDAHPTLEDEDQQMLNPSRIGVCVWGSMKIETSVRASAWANEHQRLFCRTAGFYEAGLHVLHSADTFLTPAIMLPMPC